MARYTLYLRGTDNLNTFAECWGSMPRSRGRELASGNKLIDMLPYVDKLNHDNWAIYGPGDRVVCGWRKEYYALPSVKKYLARIIRQEQNGKAGECA
jgi:hypothetical protein